MIDYTGLRKRPTFEGFVDYLANRQETIRYPDRFAKQIREHPYLTQLDGEGFWEMEELDRKRAEQEYKERTVRQVANQNNVSAQVIRAVASPASREMGTQAGPRTKTGGTQAGAQTRETGTDAPPVNMELENKLTSLEQELAVRKADDAKRDNDRRQQLSRQVAHNLRQKSSDVGVVPYISIATDDEKDKPRSRSPKRNRKIAKTEDALMLPTEPDTGASSSSGVRRASDTKEESAPKPKRGRPRKATAEPNATPLAILPPTPDPKPKALPLALEPPTSAPKPKAKRGKPKTFSISILPPTSDSKPKAKPKAKNVEADTGSTPEPKAKVGVKKNPLFEKPRHGTEKDSNPNREYWEKRAQVRGYIIDQINLRKYRGDQKELAKKLKPELINLLFEIGI